MSRKDFLRHIGYVVVGLLGVNAIISKVFDPETHLAHKPPAVKGKRRYNGGRYGV